MTPLWRLVRKLFGKPKGRHALGQPASDPDVAAPVPDPVAAVVPVIVPAPVAAVVPPAVPSPVAVAEPAPVLPLAAPVTDLGPVRLIFSDGTIAPLPAGSPEELRARYLAQRVLEATGRH